MVQLTTVVGRKATNGTIYLCDKHSSKLSGSVSSFFKKVCPKHLRLSPSLFRFHFLCGVTAFSDEYTKNTDKSATEVLLLLELDRKDALISFSSFDLHILLSFE